MHGGRTYWRILRAAATAAKWHSSEVFRHMQHPKAAPWFLHKHTSKLGRRVLGFINSPRGWLAPGALSLSEQILGAGSVHGTNDYMRWVGRSQEERSEQRKAARLCLDTSAHAGTEFQRLLTVLSNVSATSHGCDHSGCYGGTVLVDKAALHFNGAQ